MFDLNFQIPGFQTQTSFLQFSTVVISCLPITWVRTGDPVVKTRLREREAKRRTVVPETQSRSETGESTAGQAEEEKKEVMNLNLNGVCVTPLGAPDEKTSQAAENGELKCVCLRARREVVF